MKEFGSEKKLLFRLLRCIGGCFLLGFVMNQYKWTMPHYTGMLSVLFIGLAVSLFFVVNKWKINETIYRMVFINTILFFALFITFRELGLIYTSFSIQLQIMVTILLTIPVIIDLSVIFHLFYVGSLKAGDVVFLFGFLTVLVRAMYALFTPISNISRQHDTIAFTNGGGHLGYIWYIWAYGKIPHVDPRTLWEFYQPPLYYLICGYWVKIYSFFHMPITEAAENIQLVSLVCVTGTGIVLDEIAKMYSEKARVVTVLLFSLCPLFTYLAGGVNNDALLLFLFTLSIYAVIRWFQTKSWFWVLVSALLVGLTAMTKISGTLIAPAILFLFVFSLIKERGKRVRLLGQYAVFGLISLPLGLWWNVRNVICFGMPFFYFNPANPQSVQYIPEYTVLQRFFGTHNQLNHLYVELFNSSDRVDYNILITTFKTVVFTCSSETELSSITRLVGLILFIMTAIQLVLCILVCLIDIFRKSIRGDKRIYGIAFIICEISYSIFYIRFILSEPFVHTMHARYILPAIALWIPVVGVAFGDFVDNGKNGRKILYRIGSIGVILSASVLISFIILISVMTYRY